MDAISTGSALAGGAGIANYLSTVGSNTAIQSGSAPAVKVSPRDTLFI